ncbi:hypothetical protein BG015_009293 [Linnemannia schmuckeri]|uniref:Kinase n=1 Tax=Linnemannia schmuckeri TaxID=64567 RepID=A0A9P5RVP5_9FUNG|nr:hypothetical protein BG015_009293 [Linnemannia schmuckeri]
MILNPLSNQVGGHDGVLSMGDDNEIIVKPALPQELKFYEESVLHAELAAWMPTYYGTLTLTRNQPGQAGGDQTSTSAGPTIKALNGYALSDMMAASTLDQQDGANAAAAAIAETDVVAAEAEDNGAIDDECICLENVSLGFKKPCVLDLKMGTQLFDDDASEEKKARLGAVAANTTSLPLGFRMTGFEVYDSEKDSFTKYSKHYGKGLTEDTVLDGFRAYFAAKLGPERMRLIIERFINDLTDFLATIETQELRMRSSSLLMIYEGDAEAFDAGVAIEQEKIAAVVARAQAHMEKSAREDQEGDDEDEENDEDDEDDEDYDEDDEEDGEVGQKVTDMRLIDFAHSTWTPGQGPDEGVVKGVKSALALFEKLLQEDYPIDA